MLCANLISKFHQFSTPFLVSLQLYNCCHPWPGCWAAHPVSELHCPVTLPGLAAAMCGNVGNARLLWSASRGRRERAAAIRPSIIILGSSHLQQPSVDRHRTRNLNSSRFRVIRVTEESDARAASEDISDHSSEPDVWLQDEPHGADDDDAAAPDAGLRRHQAEASHQLHDEPRQHGQLQRQGQEAAGGGGECPARGSQVVTEANIRAWFNLLTSLHGHCMSTAWLTNWKLFSL